MAKRQQSLEEKLVRLGVIRDTLDAAELPLDELLNLYEEGMLLARDLRIYLEQAELRITTISQSLNERNDE
ncbi:MAG: exodeoxyribonuclease VII small subunit [Candidatus Kapabacteria bacterium]|nr:exodeoxyribonuclease VII small subunit [Candidatus Kapabacteria bacterium]